GCFRCPGPTFGRVKRDPTSARKLSASCRNRNWLWLFCAKCARQLQARFRVTLPRWPSGIRAATGQWCRGGLAPSQSAGQDRAHPLRRSSGASGENAGGIHLARASRGEDNSRDIWIDQVTKRARVRGREKRIVPVLVRLRFQPPKRACQAERSLRKCKRLRNDYSDFCFLPKPIIGCLSCGWASVFK